ncbi:TfoX/Sxy family protein [Phreatobacter sp.]|uniref:TfoX/Sxy family protein n=1 Tax=Phreatobacter sp. TaxID=1966341 RepID=UPI0022CA71FB|nr:TfoX/Sxy family protein [Phreatobacter sp.]MCZ8315001.1 TfoX/Sxy family protein [Phreatobacter sp.]
MGAFDPDVLVDLFAPFARVSLRRMFSGHGIYRDGVIFALAIGDDLFLKSDATSAPLYDAAGAKPFTYATKRGETTVGSYRRMPETCFDDEDELRHWAGIAFAAGLRAAAKPKTTRRRKALTPP